MAFVGKSLADGQLAATKGTIYTTPSLTTAYVKWLSVHNTSGSTTETILVYVKRSGSSSRIIGRAVLLPNEHTRIISDGESIVLSAGDLIEAQTSNATTVDYVISGVEEA